ncbi:aminotransferase class V-fold PLP-dependent enzyme [Laspinema sp. A4]|uniref:aminotransferase class V-fold PLP-dependent enzyme n=1 Tax=Laspinema sp. D2d TaxID=2953686 RepID=UPI0021BA624C|nr:aminotransferase class V-fold PLP-dependent enzyme [Laspinema sp. D2d]MCT7986269.1 aminotransferase class V-fold PLP-dependent enzyme [Laspinema sp. D2d]
MLKNTDLQGQRPTEFSAYWSLDPQIIFLNHGSFGACPFPVLEAQEQVRQQLEREPVRFFVREFEPLLDQAREQLAQFVGVDAQDLVFVPNATTGVNSVLRSLHFNPGDELLTTDHEYNASRNALEFIADRADARIIVVPVPFPIASKQEIVDAVMGRVTEKTKLVLLDHISSQTGLIFPIEEIIHQLSPYGIETLIDGAHAPGMLPLNLSEIGATYYSGNCHKWLSAPKGAAFLYVRGDRQQQIRPLTISHGANSPRTDKSRFQLEFDWTGTGDPSAYLSVPAAIQFMGSLLPGGWPELMSRNHQLVFAARQMLCETLGVEIPAPSEMIGSMACIPIPDGSADELHDELFDRHQIELQVMPWPKSPQRVIRISAQIYNNFEQYQQLAGVLKQVLE